MNVLERIMQTRYFIKKLMFSGHWNLLLWVSLFLPFAVQGQIANQQTQPVIRTASGGTLTATVFVGFDAKAPSRRELTWVPVTVEFQNGEDEIKGHLEVRLKNGQETYRTPVQLSPRSKKSFSLFVFVPQLLDELEFTLNTGREELPLQVVTVSTAMMENERFVAVLSDAYGSHSHMEEFKSENASSSINMVYTEPFMMPPGWIGYQNIDVLVWDNGSTAPLSPGQEQALDQWIQMGGTLILAAGESWQELNQSSFRNYMPITLNGSKVLEEGAEARSAAEGTTTRLDSSLVAATGELIQDPNIKVWLQSGRSPLLVERKWGAGRILWSAISLRRPIFQDRSFQETLVDFLTDGKIPHTVDILSRLDSDVSTFLRWVVQAELPSTWFIAGYLGLYILIIVPINYLVFRAIGRLEWAWLTVPVWALAFAFGAYYIGALRQQGVVSVNEISLVESLPNSKVAQATTFSSIYSPVRRWYTLDFTRPQAYPIIPLTADNRNRGNQRADEVLTINFMDQGHIRVEDYLIHHWSQRILKSQHDALLGNGVDIQIQFENDVATGTVTNRSGAALRRPILYLNNHYFDLGDIADGETVNVRRALQDMYVFPLEQNIQSKYSGGFGFQPPQQRQRDLNLFYDEYLKDSYPSLYLDLYGNLNTGILTTRLDQPQLAFQVQGESVAPQGLAMLCMVFPVNHILHGKMDLPMSSWNFSSRNATLQQGRSRGPMLPNPGMMRGNYPGQNYSGPGYVFVALDNSTQWDMATQIPIAGSDILSLKFHVDYESFNYSNNQQFGMMGGYGGGMPQQPRQPRPSSVSSLIKGVPEKPEDEIHLFNRVTNQLEPLSKISLPDGRIKSPHRYVDRVGGKIGLSLKPPKDVWVTIPRGAIQLEMKVDYDAATVTHFLGRPLLVVAETETSEFTEGADHDTN